MSTDTTQTGTTQAAAAQTGASQAEAAEPKKWNLIVDVAKCTNCNLCTLANQDEHVDNEFKGYSAPMPKHGHRWIDILCHERGSGPVMDVAYLPVMCQHCDDAPCIAAAKDGAVKKRADGIVLIDPVKAKGQKAIVDACPYGAIKWNEELELPQHWFFDAHLLDNGWQEPRCTQACATGALKAIKVTDDEMAAIVSREELSELKPDAATKPRVHYKNLRRFTHEFIGGTIINTVDGVTDCVADATIKLESSGSVVSEAVTDAYGEFKIDGLAPDSGAYEVVIEIGGREAKRLDVELGKSTYIGRIDLAA